MYMSETGIVVPLKEIEQTNKSVASLQDQASRLTVESPDDAESAAKMLVSIKEWKKTITGRKEEITRPLMKSLASVRDLFRGAEGSLEAAEKTIKAKMLSFQALEDVKIAMIQDKITSRVEKGTMRADTAAEKIADIKPTAMKTRTLTKVRVIDETLIPREYLVPDMKKITEAVLHTALEIPGVEKYQEKIMHS